MKRGKKAGPQFSALGPEALRELDRLTAAERAERGLHRTPSVGRVRTVWHVTPLQMLVVFPLWRAAHLIWRTARRQGPAAIVTAAARGLMHAQLPLRVAYRGRLAGLPGCIIVKAGGHSHGIVYDMYARTVTKLPRRRGRGTRRAVTDETVGAGDAVDVSGAAGVVEGVRAGSARREIAALQYLNRHTRLAPRLFFHGVLERSGLDVMVSAYAPSGYAGGVVRRRPRARDFQVVAPLVAPELAALYAHTCSRTIPVRRLLARCRRGRVGFPTLAERAAVATETLARELEIAELPAALTHGDLLPHNVCAASPHVVKLIDWGKSRRRTLFFDLLKAELAYRASLRRPAPIPPLLRAFAEPLQAGVSEGRRPRDELVCPLARALLRETERHLPNLEDPRYALLLMVAAMIELWPKKSKSGDAAGVQLGVLAAELAAGGPRSGGFGRAAGAFQKV